MLPQMSEAITLRAWRLKEESSICMEMGQGDSCRKDVHGYFYRPPPPQKKNQQKRDAISKWEKPVDILGIEVR